MDSTKNCDSRRSVEPKIIPGMGLKWSSYRVAPKNIRVTRGHLIIACSELKNELQGRGRPPKMAWIAMVRCSGTRNYTRRSGGPSAEARMQRHPARLLARLRTAAAAYVGLSSLLKS
jgi:hypothetical protein